MAEVFQLARIPGVLGNMQKVQWLPLGFLSFQWRGKSVNVSAWLPSFKGTAQGHPGTLRGPHHHPTLCSLLLAAACSPR